MHRRRLVAILIAFLLTLAVTAMWSAATLERDGDPDANMIEDSGSLAGDATRMVKLLKRRVAIR